MAKLAKHTKPYREGYRSHGETGISWALYRYPIDPETAREWQAPYYGGPGQSFCSAGWIRWRGHRVLITQYCGVDV